MSKEDDAKEICRLRQALIDIRNQIEPHLDNDDYEISQDPECFCVRCIATRALLPEQ